MTGSRGHLALADDGGSAPDITTHHRRRVTWNRWERAPQVFICVRAAKQPPAYACDACKSTERPWTTVGTVHPLPGETFPAVRNGWAPAPAWPLRQLHAFRCPACRDTRIYDMGRSMTGWDEVMAAEELTLW